jgi:hypothetical protein
MAEPRRISGRKLPAGGPHVVCHAPCVEWLLGWIATETSLARICESTTGLRSAGHWRLPDHHGRGTDMNGPHEREPAIARLSFEEKYELLMDALHGVELGAYDESVVRYLCLNVDSPILAVLVGWIERRQLVARGRGPIMPRAGEVPGRGSA